MSGLDDSHCQDSSVLLSIEESENYLLQLKDWRILHGHDLQKKFLFKDFEQALRFVLQVADISEAEQHHPIIEFSWGWVNLTIFTHQADGLTRNDFILAAKIDQLND